MFSHCSTGIYWAFDGKTEFSQVFKSAILSYTQIVLAYENNILHRCSDNQILSNLAIFGGHPFYARK